MWHICMNHQSIWQIQNNSDRNGKICHIISYYKLLVSSFLPYNPKKIILPNCICLLDLFFFHFFLSYIRFMLYDWIVSPFYCFLLVFWFPIDLYLPLFRLCHLMVNFGQISRRKEGKPYGISLPGTLHVPSSISPTYYSSKFSACFIYQSTRGKIKLSISFLFHCLHTFRLTRGALCNRKALYCLQM
jgi:hypothetical protein